MFLISWFFCSNNNSQFKALLWKVTDSASRLQLPPAHMQGSGAYVLNFRPESDTQDTWGVKTHHVEIQNKGNGNLNWHRGEARRTECFFEMIVWTIILTLLLRSSVCLKLKKTAANVFYCPVLTGVLPIYLATWIPWEENNLKRAFTTLNIMLPWELLQTLPSFSLERHCPSRVEPCAFGLLLSLWL